MQPGRRALLLAAALAPAGVARAQSATSVTLAGRMGERALLVVDGRPLTLAPGASAAGVKLLRWHGAGATAEAEIELDGQRFRLREGGTPSRVGAPPAAAAREIVMTAGPGGHFTPEGSIDGRPVRFIVDTGATLVALGRDEAERLRLDLSRARSGISRTANGEVRVQLVTLGRVRVGEVELAHIAGVVMPQPLPYVLLGNSFLTRFEMRREGDQMRLSLR